MSTLAPGRLRSISGIADAVTVFEDNSSVLTEEIFKWVPSYQNGVQTVLIGPPTSGDRVANERWKDANIAEYRCIGAGNPGTWRQQVPAVTNGEPNSGTYPTGYLINDSADSFTLKKHDGGYVWTDVYLVNASGTAGNGIVISGSKIHAVQSSNYTANALIFANSTTTLSMSSNLTWNGSMFDINVASARLRVQDGTNILTIGQWDGANNRIESTGRSLLITTYTGSINLGLSGGTSWSIIAGGILQSSGAQTIQTSTGNLTIATAAGNGNILLSPHGTGKVGVGITPGAKFHVADTSDTWIYGTYTAAQTAGYSVVFRAANSSPQFMGELRFTSDNGSNNASTGQLNIGNGSGGAQIALSFTSTGAVTLPVSLTISTLTPKSVLFAGASLAVSQDNANFQYDSTGKSFAVGIAALASVGGYFFRLGAKTVGDTGLAVTNNATSSTASIDRIGIDIDCTGTWNGTSAVNYGIFIRSISGGTTNWALFNNTAANCFLGTGKIGIGTTTLDSSAANLEVSGSIGVYISGVMTNRLVIYRLTDSTTYGVVTFNGAITAAGYAGFAGGGDSNLYANVPTAGRFQWNVNNVLKLVVDASGNVGVLTSTFGTNAAGVVCIKNGTPPTTSPVDSVQLYAEDVSASSELKVRDEVGNVTTLSPHNFSRIPRSEEMAWSYYSERDGKYITVDMCAVVRELERLTGKEFVFIGKIQNN